MEFGDARIRLPGFSPENCPEGARRGFKFLFFLVDEDFNLRSRLSARAQGRNFRGEGEHEFEKLGWNWSPGFDGDVGGLRWQR
jgi:hypothetical protein